ncbi:hypothetical protein SAMN05216389_12113 [Oceanobacillus limi]|uniref:Phage protein n=1 Tax=Oceanobacillus limi TaxID=930131 RepID=A0A1I0GGL5_9BACI|nr:hypothetical protein [Oceanobacillus limi]SET69257.1 hypothetical protein SAMN05216389_12113 [Oceanobacillus limi]
MTYREFAMICEENIERTHDENEREAMYAIMYAAASRGKGKQGKLPKLDDLYKRPSAEDIAGKTVEEIREQQEHTKEWLAQFDLSKLNGKEDDDK